MEVRVIREDKNEMEVAIEGEDTLVPLLKAYLAEDEDVDVAAFRREHPLKGTFYIFVRTKKGRPKEAILRALDRIKADIAALSKALKGLKI